MWRFSQPMKMKMRISILTIKKEEKESKTRQTWPDKMMHKERQMIEKIKIHTLRITN
jgi:hypothetical protein